MKNCFFLSSFRLVFTHIIFFMFLAFLSSFLIACALSLLIFFFSSRIRNNGSNTCIWKGNEFNYRSIGSYWERNSCSVWITEGLHTKNRTNGKGKKKHILLFSTLFLFFFLFKFNSSEKEKRKENNERRDKETTGALEAIEKEKLLYVNYRGLTR